MSFRMLDISGKEKASHLRVVDRSNPILWTPAEPVRDIASEVVPHIAPMYHLMHVGPIKAVGLAAPQVGIPLRFFLTKFDHLYLVVNPEIVAHSETSTSKQEGCMSWNGGKSRVFVRRFDWIRLRYMTREGKLKTETLTELEARVAQHEIDHLNGVNIFTRS